MTEVPTRERILNAAFTALLERGYSGLTTREIAARAQVSKRELYAEFGNKQGIFGALVSSRAARMRQPLDGASIDTARAFADTLARVGVAYLTGLTDPAVVSIFRLAIAGAEESPELSRVLDDHARAPNRKALVDLMQRGRSAGWIRGEPAEVAGRFFAELMGDIHVSLLLGRIARPTAREIDKHAKIAVDAVLQIYGTRRASQ